MCVFLCLIMCVAVWLILFAVVCLIMCVIVCLINTKSSFFDFLFHRLSANGINIIIDNIPALKRRPSQHSM